MERRKEKIRVERKRKEVIYGKREPRRRKKSSISMYNLLRNPKIRFAEKLTCERLGSS